MLPTTAQSPCDRLSKEIKRYQTYPVIDGDEDPLKCWQRNEVDFPLLCQLARKYLAIQASSSPSKRLFSKAGLVSTPSQAKLKPEKVDLRSLVKTCKYVLLTLSSYLYIYTSVSF